MSALEGAIRFLDFWTFSDQPHVPDTGCRPGNRRLQVAVLDLHVLLVQPLPSLFSQLRDVRPSWEVTHSRSHRLFEAEETHWSSQDSPQCGQMGSCLKGKQVSLEKGGEDIMRTECLSSRAIGGQIHWSPVKVKSRERPATGSYWLWSWQDGSLTIHPKTLICVELGRGAPWGTEWQVSFSYLSWCSFHCWKECGFDNCS